LYVLEAWSAGVPVVQPAHGSFPELIERTGGGRIVPPGNSDALAGVLRELLLDRTLCRDLGERGRRGIEQDFTAEAMARQVLAVVQKISAAEQPQPQVMSHA
jgi:glycosyltransferase involved in cell wall biosynthesis